jgi:hypothetical protein
MNLKELRKRLAELKLQFLEEKGTDGGTATEFQNYALGKILESDFDDVVSDIARDVFRQKRVIHDERQLNLDGHVLPDVLVYEVDNGLDEPGEFQAPETRQVLTHHATVYQYILQDEIVQANRVKIVESALEHAAIRNRLVEMAAGDVSRLIRELI